MGMGLEDSMTSSFKMPPKTPSKVSFAGLAHLDHDLDDEKETNDPRFKHSNSDVGEKPHAFPGIPKSNMRRSQSYSALSSTIADTVKAEEERKTVKRTSSFTEEEYRTYYLKFVDLVITREVTAAIHVKYS
jgi:hypothetical protein